MKNCNTEQLPLKYFKKMKDVEENLVAFLEKQDQIDGSFAIFNNYLKNQKLHENKYEIKSFLLLIVSISNNYHRSDSFFHKIEMIIQSLHEQIENFFNSFEIFHIFQSNKRLLLFLFKSEFIAPTEEIYFIISCNKKYSERKYLEYFFPEFETYFDDRLKTKIQTIKEINIDEFNKKREIGENDDYLCNLIRNDQIVDFIICFEQNNISPTTIIKSSIYETNLFLINKEVSLIEYSAFCGSIQIFKYLHIQKVQLTTSIWPYAIHGRNAEIIQFLEEQKIKTLCDSRQYLVIESIKCHHNEITEYLQSNLCDKEKIYNNYLYRKSLKSYNFIFFTDEIVCSLINSCKSNEKLNVPYYLSKYDYFLIVEFLCKENLCDINCIYTIYKPLPKQKENIIKYIDMKNGIVDQQTEEEKLIEIEDPEKYKDILEIIKYTTNEYEYNTSTILHIAVQKGNIDIIQFLLKLPQISLTTKSKKFYKTRINNVFSEYYYLNTKEKSIFNEAVESGFSEVVHFLIENSCFNVNDKLIKTTMTVDYLSPEHSYYKEKYSQSLLHQAIKKGNLYIIKLLLSDPKIRINEKSFSEIKNGCKDYRECPRTIEKYTLYFAIKYMNLKAFQLLIKDCHIDIDSGLKEIRSENDENIILRDKSPLYLAVEYNNCEAVKLLLIKPNINVNFESTNYIYENCQIKEQKITALKLAIEKESKEILLLLEKK